METVYSPNFELLNSDASWRSSWSHIIPGRFSSSPYTGLLFYEQSTGYAEVYETDGQGKLVAPPLQVIPSLGDHESWTHIIPGYFGLSGLTGLLLYDQPNGYARFLNCTEGAVFTPFKDYTDWRNTWTQIVPGFFTASHRTSLLFYSPSEGYGELWETDELGLRGHAPVQMFTDWRSTWTHIVSGFFYWIDAPIVGPHFSGLFFYQALDGWAEMYACDENGLIAGAQISGNVMPSASNVVAGNFGGFGFTDVLLHNGSSGEIKVYSFDETMAGESSWVEHDSATQLRSTVDLVVPGKFYVACPDDEWFISGPKGPAYHFTVEDNNWRDGPGAFSDLLLYDRAAGLGETYLHGPPPPPVVPLDAYISTEGSSGSSTSRETGSLLPGETISFHVSTENTYSVTLYQQGYFGPGVYERQAMQLKDLPATGALPIHRLAYKEGAQWPVSASATLVDFPPGFYRAHVQDAASNIVDDLYFVVRTPGPPQSKILMVIADVTYAAYNDWGGRNVYGYATCEDTADGLIHRHVATFPQSGVFSPYAFQVSFNRPRGYTLGNGSENQEAPMVQWLMKSGVAVDVCTARDLHFTPPSLSDFRLLLFAGHHEYWSWEMRDHVEAFVQAGGGAAFFCANTSWWQVRIAPNGKKLWCYKIKEFDPVLASSPERTTVNWYDSPVGRPETAMTGASYYGSPWAIPTGTPYTVVNAAHWAFEGTGLEKENGFGLFNCVANACDSVIGGELEIVQSGTANGMVSPPGYEVASAYDQDNNKMATMGSFQLGEGEVFNAATINWANGLAFDNDPCNKVPQITMNVINRLGPAFQPLPGAAYDVGVGADGTVWVVGTDTRPSGSGYGIYQWDGTIWIPAPGAAVRIAVDPDGSPWAVTVDDVILRMVSGEWQEMPGRARDIGVGADGSVWVIGVNTPHHGGDYGIYRWNGASWDNIEGAAVRVAVGPSGNAWVVNHAGALYEYVGSTWVQRPGPLAADIGVGPGGTVWVIGKDEGIYRWNGVDDWRQVDGAAVGISVEPGGNPWVVNSGQEIYYWG